ncbi:MAG: helix-turn-helix domain-containing protein [Acutalibacteraceae bacterium]
MKNDDFLIKMGSRIAEQRKLQKMTQEQLADKMDVSLQSVSSFELGKKSISSTNLAKLCDCLNVTSDYILYGRRDEKQISSIVSAISKLGKEEFNIVKSLVEYFDNKAK